jgi:Zn-dependent protease with chaperone function
MPQFLNTDSLTALGWSLLNGIWQMGILWLGYLLLTRNHKRFSAAARHNLALFFSGLGFIWFLYSLFRELVYPSGITGWKPVNYFFSKISFVISPLLSVLTVIYLTILVFRAGRYIVGFYQMQISRRGFEVSFSEPLQLFSNRISPVMGIGKQISIFLVGWVDTAQTVGFFKPLILLPVALMNRLTMEQVETILLHELLHIRRNDYLIHILMTLFHAVFFFNPFARFFFKTVAQEREHACDDGVLQWDYPASVYAEALFTLEKFRQLPHSFSLAANGNDPRLLMERIRRVVGEPASGKNPFSPLLSFSMIAALLIFTSNSFSRFPRPDTGIQPHIRLTAVTNTSYVSAVGKASGPMTKDNGKAERNKPADRVNESAIKSIKAPPPPLKAKYQKPSIIVNDAAILVKLDEEGVKDQMRYADHNELRNYSNQKASEPELPVVADLEGVPYVPSASFSYQPAGDTLQPDQLLQNKWKALVGMGKIKTAELQAKLNEEIVGKMKELRQMEKENRKLIEQKQKNLQPVLHKIKEDMQRKKEEIDRLRMQIQIQGGEIIFI